MAHCLADKVIGLEAENLIIEICKLVFYTPKRTRGVLLRRFFFAAVSACTFLQLSVSVFRCLAFYHRRRNTWNGTGLKAPCNANTNGISTIICRNSFFCLLNLI